MNYEESCGSKRDVILMVLLIAGIFLSLINGIAGAVFLVGTLATDEIVAKTGCSKYNKQVMKIE